MILVAFWGNGPHGTDLYAGQTIPAWNGICPLLAIKTDHRCETPTGKIHEGCAVLLAADLNAFAAQDAPVGVVVQKRMIINYFLIFQGMFKAFGLETFFQEPGDILQFAFLVGGTMAAVNMVNGQKQFQCCSLQPPHRRGVGLHRHVFYRFYLA